MADADELLAEIEALFEELIAQQRRKVAEMARRIDPRLTDDDLLSPMDLRVLAENPAWNYEDGILNGYLAAQMAARRRLRR